MQITGTHFNYYLICHRKLWLFANGINMEHNSDLVYDGKLIHEDSYPQRPERYEELEVDGVKIDFADSWVHLRKSNTEPIIRIYSEASTMEKADELAQQIKDVITSLVE